MKIKLNIVYKIWSEGVSDSGPAAITKYYNLSGLNSRNICITVLEAGKPKNEVTIDLIPDENSFLLADRYLPAGSSHGQEIEIFLCLLALGQ